MNKIYVFGSTGMLGRYVLTYLKENMENYKIITITRADIDITKITYDELRRKFLFWGLSTNDIIVNCAGMIKQRNDSPDSDFIIVNSLFPHHLVQIAKTFEANIIHISTDCFLPNTKVITNKMIQNIEDIKINDLVYTHTGKLQRVYDIKQKQVNEEILSIKCLGKDEFKCTKNHPFLIIKRKSKQKPKLENKEWVLAKDLELNNLIVIPKLKIPEISIFNINLLNYSDKYKYIINEYEYFENNIKSKKFDNFKKYCRDNNLNYRKINQWIYDKSKPKIISLKQQIIISNDLMWFFGLFLADGWVDNNIHRKSIHLTIENNDVLINKIVNVIKKEFDKEVNIRYIRNQKSCEIYFTHQLLSEMLSTDFYISEKHYSYTKKIPQWIRCIGKENIISFIDGYFHENGHNILLTMSSVSEALINEMNILFNYIGILSYKNTLRKNKTGEIQGRKVNLKTSYILSISGSQIEKANKFFNLKSNLFDNYKRYQKFFEDDNNWYVPINKIIKENYSGYVYNLEVEDDHSYLINGGLSAHNCVYDGKSGSYDENSKHNADDLYGKSKSLGEPIEATIIRTSIIGEEVNNKKSLLEWVKSNKNKNVFGFTNHTWNGVTCLQLSKIIKQIIDENLYWAGVRHIFSPRTLNKYELVKLISDVFKLKINITEKETTENCFRNLSSVYDEVNYFNIPDLSQQIKELEDYDVINR
jgi:dTDP-4-dehydrorhamnose reductase/CRISPR/Cas system CMR-associated protein Cmr5 small subunit